MKLRTLAWGSGLALSAAAVGHAAMRTTDGRAVDRELFGVLNRDRGRDADRFFGGLTELGSLYASASAALVLVAFGRRRPALHALAAAGTTWALGQGLKRLVDRPRPYDEDPQGTRLLIAEPHGTSWPSSHPAVLTTFTRVAARELGAGTGAKAALGALDLSVAASRVYLGVHYPADVAAGLLMGRAVARLWPRGRRSRR